LLKKLYAYSLMMPTFYNNSNIPPPPHEFHG
jgi:hypothetical protein